MSQIAFSYQPVSPARVFLWALLACLSGVALAPYLPEVSWVGWLVSGTVLSAVLTRRGFRIGFCILAGFLLGWWRYGLVSIDNSFAAVFDQSATLSGAVVSEVDRRVDRQRLSVAIEHINDQPAAGTILITAPLYPVVAYGDVVTGRCNVRRPGTIEDFQYDRYLALSGTSAYCSVRSIEIVEQKRGSFLMMPIIAFKQSVLVTINRLLPEPEASFAAGLLLGVRRSIPEEVQTAFNRTGTTHIIAISGYNITLIATIIQAMLVPMVGRKKAFWLVVAALGVFVILTGAQASVVRAGIMGVIALLARRVGRRSRMINLLVLAAVGMVLSNPLLLRDDKGFQLSFLATVGLVFLSPALERWTRGVTQRFGLRESLTATLASTIATLPLIVTTFGRLSLIAVVANLIVLPMIPVAMAVSFGALVASVIWQPLATVISWVAWCALHYVIVVTGWLAGFSWSSIEVPSVPWWVTLGGFVFLSIIMLPRLELVRPARRGFRYEH